MIKYICVYRERDREGENGCIIGSMDNMDEGEGKRILESEKY
jgi:hypothetical protein